MTAKEAITSASARIPLRDAETLLQHVAGRDRAWLLAHPEAQISPEQQRHFRGLAGRRGRGEPLQYLTGEQEFFGLRFFVSPDVLIPRPETELLVEAVLDWMRKGEQAPGCNGRLRVVDVGTGSGAIALSLAAQMPGLELWAVDLSEAALGVARRNAAQLGLADAVRFCHSDLLSVFRQDAEMARERIDVVVSNPPYVPLADAPTMQPEVRDHEPHTALFAGEDGLAIYRRLIPEAWAALRVGGLLAMEIGFGQRDALAELLQTWRNVRFLDDYAGIPRHVLAEHA